METLVSTTSYFLSLLFFTFVLMVEKVLDGCQVVSSILVVSSIFRKMVCRVWHE